VSDDQAKTQEQLLITSRIVLTVRAMGYPKKLSTSMELKPHTWIYLKLKPDLPTYHDKQRIAPLGVVFHRWSRKYSGITFTQKGVYGRIVRRGEGRFANDRSGKELGLIVDERWIWDDLIRQFKGLSHGNM